MQNPFHASYWTYPDQFSARNHQRARYIQPHKFLSNEKINKFSDSILLSRLKFTEFREFSHQLVVQWKLKTFGFNCQDFLQKLNPTRAESQPA